MANTVYDLQYCIYVCFVLPSVLVLVVTLWGAFKVGWDAKTISELATENSTISIAFGVAMGIASVLLPIGAALIWTRSPDDRKFKKEWWFKPLYCACVMGIAVGCMGLAIMTVRRNQSGHYGFATAAFVGQMVLGILLAMINKKECKSLAALFLAILSILFFAIAIYVSPLKDHACWGEFAFVIFITWFVVTVTSMEDNKANQSQARTVTLQGFRF